MLDMRIELAVLFLDINGDFEGILNCMFVVDVRNVRMLDSELPGMGFGWQINNLFNC